MSNLVVGASLKPFRYSNMAIKRLLEKGHEVVAVGLKEGNVDGVEIQTGFPSFDNIDTVLLYVNPSRQVEFYDYIKGLKPRRVIFNPGTENAEFEAMLSKEGVEPITACSLVMLSTGQW